MEPNGKRLAMARQFFKVIPHSRALGMEPVEIGGDYVIARLPYGPELVGNPDTGVVHGGVITTLVDQTSGAAVVATLDPPQAVATLDLRIDHLRPAEPGRDVLARAHCYRLTSQIAFVRCLVYQHDPEAPVATSMSTFMRIHSQGPNMGQQSLTEGVA